MLLNSQVPPKANCTIGLRSCDARAKARGTDQVEYINALTPMLTYRIQAELTQSQAEGNKKRPNSIKFIQIPNESYFRFRVCLMELRLDFNPFTSSCPWTTCAGLHEGQWLLGRGFGIPTTAVPAKSRLPGRLGHSERISGFSCSFLLTPGSEPISHGSREHLAQP